VEAVSLDEFQAKIVLAEITVDFFEILKKYGVFGGVPRSMSNLRQDA